jgi:primosomal protein N'
MYLIKAIPISRGISADILSYWSPSSAPKGSVIKVPLRRRIVGAIVVSSEHALEAKSEIRGAEFEVKKIESVKPRQIFLPEFFRVAEEVSHYYAASVGSVLFSLIPSAILADTDKVPEIDGGLKRNKLRDSYVLQKPDDDRYAHYKSLIRERFAKKQSVFMVMPTAEDIKRAQSFLEKGIEPYTYILHSGLTRAEVLKIWKKALEDTHPIVIVATGTFLSLPRNDITLYIVERENSRAYKDQTRPFLDERLFVERFAVSTGADIIFGDSYLRVETLYREEEDKLVEYAPLSMRSLSTARDMLIDMKAKRDPESRFTVLSRDLIDLVKKNKEESGLMFIFAGRKGLSPSTVCADCESVVSCEECSAPLVLHGGGDRRFYLCNRCGRRYDAETKCRDCGSWRLQPLGIGTELVEEELKKAVPGISVMRFDKISMTSHKKAQALAEKWYSSPGSVLVGTELALLYLDRPIDASAVASLDAFFSIPDFRINEKIFSIILRMRSITRKDFLLQTRKPDEPVLTYGIKGNIVDFYRSEIEERRRAHFPPFGVFIKISYTGKREDTLLAMENLKKELRDYTVTVFPAFIATVKNQLVMNALIRLRPGEWPDDKLLEHLRALPPSYAINVDPESLI